MSNLNWGMIYNGTIFESLVHAILFNKDNQLLLFGRPGKDSGQDARSSDGEIVYQAKYRQNMNFDDAISLAKKELRKIQTYKNKEHSNYKHWENVRQWILIGNFSSNPNDAYKWETNVASEFKKESIKASYWGIESLERELEALPDIKEVYFCGENRTFIELKEAYDLLSSECISTNFLDMPLFGREREIQYILEFAESSDKRLLFIAGVAGIGKSRLAYEALSLLSQNEWRVYWALPEMMNRSSKWFYLFDSRFPTCIVIDNPESASLIRATIEQLSTAERKKWKAIIICRSENSEVLHQYKTNKLVTQALTLSPLNEAISHKLIKECLANPSSATLIHSIYRYTQGIPGWICLISDLLNKRTLADFHEDKDNPASLYINSCLKSLGKGMQPQANTIIRWVSLWKKLRVLSDKETNDQIKFLSKFGLTEETIGELCQTISTTGLLHSCSCANSLYSIEPALLREQILSNWLLEKNDHTYTMSSEGNRIINELIKGGIPNEDIVLSSLSNLVHSRLDTPDEEHLVSPIFTAFEQLSINGTILDQFRITDLLTKCGVTNPDMALDVFIAIRENYKEPVTQSIPLWGDQILSHELLISQLPSKLFEIAKYVYDYNTAYRYLLEYNELINVSLNTHIQNNFHKQPADILRNLLSGCKNWQTFTLPAFDIAKSAIESQKISLFINQLISSLFNPEVNYSEWTANWTISLVKRFIMPTEEAWAIRTRLRDVVYKAIRTIDDKESKISLWNIISESHQEYHRAILFGNFTDKIKTDYYSILVSDLKQCLTVLTAPDEITIVEATAARDIWAWYLKYGKDPRLCSLAKDCEGIYNSFSKWRIQTLFRFDTDEELRPELESTTKALREGNSVDLFYDFFTEANQYLAIARHGRLDGMDFFIVSKLAKLLSNDFDPLDNKNALSSFVMSNVKTLSKPEKLVYHFAIRIIQEYLKRKKESEKEESFNKIFNAIMATPEDKHYFIYEIYNNCHQNTIGKLTKIEFEYICSLENKFEERQLFILYGLFSIVFFDKIRNRVIRLMKNSKNTLKDMSNAFGLYIRFFEIGMLRYDAKPNRRIVLWIISIIINFNLDGILLEMNELTTIRDHSKCTLFLSQFYNILKKRIALEKKDLSKSLQKIMPYNFPVTEWCKFCPDVVSTKIHFFDICNLIFESTFISLYELPKYISQLNPAGNLVEEFVVNYLESHSPTNIDAISRLSYLASAFPDNTEAWSSIAYQICLRSRNLRRNERERIYFNLSRKETGVIHGNPGEVPSYYIVTYEKASQRLNSEPYDSPLRGYREWAQRQAEIDLQQAQRQAEEDANG